MPMNERDLAICQEIHAGLTSRERNNFNYIFLQPVDTSFFPTYLQVVKRPMDLQTLKSNLDTSVYATREEFYDDTTLIFDNAIAFNKDRPDSNWVVDLAKRMSKAFDRVRKNAEKKAARAANAAGEEFAMSSWGTEDSKSSGSSVSGTGGAGGREGKQKGEATAAGGGGGAGSAAASTVGKKKKISIKLKGPSADGGESAAARSGEPAKPPKKAKLKLKLSRSSSQSNSGAIKSSSPGAGGGSSDIVETVTQAPMNDERRAQCYKILASLKRRQPSTCKWFQKPVSDPMLVKDYREKIANPIDLSSIMSKLDKNQYKHLGDFVLDLRRITSNCLQYNTSVDDSYRPIARDFLTLSEDLCRVFIAKVESPKVVYPSILCCWADCIGVIDELVNMTNLEDEHQTAWFFLQPVDYFCGGEYPPGYLEKVKEPIDLGTIVQNLLTGVYKSVGAFATDCRRVVENCNTFYEGDEEGAMLCEKANRLLVSMDKNLNQLMAFDRSEKGAKAREKALRYMVIKKPEKDFLRDIMRELRAATYTDKGAQITEKATLHFEKPVDTKLFTDYRSYVDNPMDLETIDKKIDSGTYETPEDFEYDVALIFKNCERYNGPKKNHHMVALGKHTAKLFRKLFAAKMMGGAPKRNSLPTVANRASEKMAGKKRPASTSPVPEERKRVSIKMGSKSMSPPSAKMTGKMKDRKKMSKSTTPKIAPRANPSAPVPMHVAIAMIKEDYPGRRQIKDLEGWEAECMKFMRQLMKHPWVSAERPKYIFHVPVSIIFPEIGDSYAAKIKNPMDLTTAEAKLLQGVYSSAEEFISDIALVFSNAIEFNKEGHDVGEPMSCAYYEASTHLLKYIRWLSLEVLSSYLIDCPRSPVVESGSVPEWRLTVRNRKMARKEMESIVFNELLDKTERGDKYSWSEQECEKLLKALRHMSDLKHMGYFVQMSFPPDYTAYISKPIAWDMCNQKLKDRKYCTIGECVSDLRLIFENALKYNEGARHVSKVSGLAYDSAIHMSEKLEAAIDKMFLSVGDRIGRERIDMITSQREMEAIERAEEEQRRQAWERENPGSKMEVKTKLRIVHQRQRKQRTDFEFPFYDEKEDEEMHADSLEHLKAMYEKQREARANMQEMALTVAANVFQKLRERAAARAWVAEMTDKANAERRKKEDDENTLRKEVEAEGTSEPRGSCVLQALNDSARKQIKMSIPKPKKAKRKLTSFMD